MKGENFILSIAIDKYSDNLFDNLENAVFDADRFLNVLSDRYEFKPIQDPLYNEIATRRNIIDVLNTLSSSISANDNLIIYYAGHGRVNPKTNKGFWIPYDGNKDSISNFISNSEIIDCIEAMDAKHILLISDSCFSGALLTKTRSVLDEKYYLKLDEKKSRYMFSSGRIESVSDGHPGKGSPFANALIKYLEDNEKKYFAFTEMATTVKKITGSLTSQQPIYGTISGLNYEGEMVFRLKEKQVTKDKLFIENQSSWDINFKVFCDAKETRKEWPFISKENPETKSLGVWCSDQRSYKRKGKLSPDREQRLRNAGFVFDPQLEKFFKGLAKFLIFMEKEKGYNYVPRHLRLKYNEEESWQRVQQRWYRKSPCNPTNPKSYPLYRYEILRKNNIQLAPIKTSEQWENFQKNIIIYYSTHEKFITLPSQNDKNPDIAALGNRLNDYMVHWKRKKLGSEKVKFLEKYVDINFGKNKIRRTFEKQVMDYVNFKKLFPNSEPTQTGKYKILAGRIANWKSKKKRGKLPSWQEKILRFYYVPIDSPIIKKSAGLLF